MLEKAVMALSFFKCIRLALVAILLLVVTTGAASILIKATKAPANKRGLTEARQVISTAEHTVDSSVLTVTVTKTRYHAMPEEQDVAKRDVVDARSAESTSYRPLTGIGAQINTKRPPKGMSALSGQPTNVVSEVSVS
jgi:hypothetical protein